MNVIAPVLELDLYNNQLQNKRKASSPFKMDLFVVRNQKKLSPWNFFSGDGSEIVLSDERRTLSAPPLVLH